MDADDSSSSEHEKPRYLLPDGCKDIWDVLRLEKTPPAERIRGTPEGDMELPDPVVLRMLAEALQRKPFELIADLLRTAELFSTVNSELDFEIASALCAHYGVTARRLGP